MVLLERRLDNVVYRMGFASTRAEARQLVAHKAILVNDKVVNIPSYLGKSWRCYFCSPKGKGSRSNSSCFSSYLNKELLVIGLTVDSSSLKGTFSTVPTLTDLSSDYNVNLSCRTLL